MGNGAVIARVGSEDAGCQIGLSLGCHSVVELDDHLGVEKMAWGHKWLQGVPMH